MTRTITSISLREITTLTVACASCGYAVTVPVDAPHLGSEVCGKCGMAFPARAIAELAGQIENMRKVLAVKERASLDVTFEIMQKE